ncbi:Uu.00g010230.m01.CDS01 [Anthostomella pinea]|uniref:Uu.00g010230.m01.CDS01 n=1 Tax=Anthostomella pinea TaxID=933095 RepID=A0AAI8YPX7_9PEZI|nr:Uu.00g010230.m01.CDS01 [Anthostomella pinea]
MGRRPNPLILEFFERGAKLNDNSNRYHHRCKACGEDFPKGRIDSLTSHLTKKCPAISEAERINACLSLHGINNGSGRQKYDGLLHSGPNTGPSFGQNLSHNHDQNQSQIQDSLWTPLETLAEVSRQIEASEKHDDHVPTIQDPTSEAVQTTLAAALPATLAPGSNPFELHEQFTLENPPMSYENRPQRDKKDASQQSQTIPQNELSAEERLQQLFQSTGSPTQSALSVAAAATARLNPSLLDPQLDHQILTDETIAEHIAQSAASTEMMIDYPEHEKSPQPAPPPAPVNHNDSLTPWGGMTYMPDDIHAPATVNDHSSHMVPTLNRGGFRMDTTDSPNGPRYRHSRARFDSSRRREVQEVRRIGACIRCRILRKTCSKGTPCDTCKKVLSPRVWRTGCVRTKLSEYIDLYSAGVQVVMAQKRINGYKSSHQLENVLNVVEVSHFPETGHKVVFQVLQGYPKGGEGENGDNGHVKVEPPGPVILLDNNKEDVPGKVEGYMRRMLPEFIRREPSSHVRVTLEAADQLAKDTNDELLKRSLELWGIVEMMDRERQWTMLVKSPRDEVPDSWIKDETECEAYSNICMQLTAAAERKASIASKNLLNGIQRNLQDGKTKLGFPMFLTVILFLNCVEKTTWAFKAWDEENLRPKWPLEKPPSNYTSQGHGLTELLRMLLVIRHILPKTSHPDPDAPITTEEDDPIIEKYFQDLNITPAYLHMRHEQNNFQPTDSRSLEFLFCAPLLLNYVPAPQATPQGTPQGTPQDAPQGPHLGFPSV